MISHLQMITIYVSDMDRSLEFYTNKFGFVKLAEFDDGENHLVWIIPEQSKAANLATQIALYVPADKEKIGSASGLVFTADNIEQTYHELKARGVQFTMELTRHAYGQGEGDQEARFVDPDGNLFLLHT